MRAEHRSVIHRLPDGSAAQACLCMLIHLLLGCLQPWKALIFQHHYSTFIRGLRCKLLDWEMRPKAAKGLHQELRC